MLLFLVLYIYYHKAFIRHFQYKSSILVKMILYFSNSLSSSTHKDINLLFLSLEVLTYLPIMGNQN